jgi:SAM-dependent methyltransferase
MRGSKLASDINIETVRAILAPHARLYRIRTPIYQTVLLQSLRAVWDPAHRKVLDVGGGTGLLAEAIQKLFPVDKIVSLDVENRFLPNLSITTAVSTTKKLPFSDGSFDCVVMNNVLHHVPRQDRIKLLSECKRVAGPIYVKDHVAATTGDHVRLHILDMIGNLPFKGMVKAQYLSLAEWQEVAAFSGYKISINNASRYRRGITAAIFPNRLECLIRFSP